ncbi:hypothetical protein [Burkholderia metallica]|uniref:hypothetical protein n=1 Tax=Burkholderia metallica TaxID=488729 RepID=UPI0020C6B6C9|nr:hypothetical protein [Burkholderia metallica]
MDDLFGGLFDGRPRPADLLLRARAGREGKQVERPQPEAGFFPGHVQFRAGGRPWQEKAAESGVGMKVE